MSVVRAVHFPFVLLIIVISILLFLQNSIIWSIFSACLSRNPFVLITIILVFVSLFLRPNIFYEIFYDIHSNFRTNLICIDELDHYLLISAVYYHRLFILIFLFLFYQLNDSWIQCFYMIFLLKDDTLGSCSSRCSSSTIFVGFSYLDCTILLATSVNF